jgi:hypothetical protein
VSSGLNKVKSSQEEMPLSSFFPFRIVMIRCSKSGSNVSVVFSSVIFAELSSSSMSSSLLSLSRLELFQ